MEILGFVFGLTGAGVGLLAYFRLNALEKKLKDSGVLDKDFNSEDHVP